MEKIEWGKNIKVIDSFAFSGCKGLKTLTFLEGLSGIGQRVVRADGIGGVEMLSAVLSLIPLDTYVTENFLLMQTVQGDPMPKIWDEYFVTVKKYDDNLRAGNLERFAFYERAKKAYAVIATGESAVYANIILKNGVII